MTKVMEAEHEVIEPTKAALTTQQRLARQKYARFLYSKEGKTYQEIGDELGVSRERARQIVRGKDGYDQKRPNAGDLGRWTGTDLYDKLRDAVGLRDAARRVGVHENTLVRHLTESGKIESYRRLWRRNAKEVRKKELIDHMKALAEALGHTPGQHEINRANGPSHMSYVKTFGSLTQAQVEAGLLPNTRGG